MHAVNMSASSLFRAVGGEDRQPTILYDEIDTLFGPKAKGNEEIRGLLNAGHRRGAEAYRCVGQDFKVVAFPAFCALAVAGLGRLPDTIATRSVIIRMRRRAPNEVIEPFRFRVNAGEGYALRERLAVWAASVEEYVKTHFPDMPAGVTDRPADVWEPLLSVAEAAGGHWPELARESCIYITSQVTNEDERSLGVRLLGDLRHLFIRAGDPSTLSTERILEGLMDIEDAPWRDIRGTALDARGLARLLRVYEVKSASVRTGSRTSKGYRLEDLVDPWSRYLPPPVEEGHRGHKRHIRIEVSRGDRLDVPDVPDVPAVGADGARGRPGPKAVIVEGAEYVLRDVLHPDN
jgi:hypothetical protein